MPGKQPLNGKVSMWQGQEVGMEAVHPTAACEAKEQSSEGFQRGKRDGAMAC